MGLWSKDDEDGKQNNPLSKYISLTPETDKQLNDGYERIQSAFTDNRGNFHVDLDSKQWMMAVGTASIASFLLGVRAGRLAHRPIYQPIKSLQDLNSSEIGRGQASWLRGRVVSVSDGDTIRFLHQPLPFLHNTKKDDDHDKSHRLAIRLCTIDTPETAKFGNPGMAYGQEAKQHLTDLCLDKIVQIQLLQVDQYGRGVAQVRRPGFFFGFPRTYLDEAMLKAGLAEVYLGSGAVYGRLSDADNKPDPYLKLMEKVKRAKKGMWVEGDKRETAAEYKRRCALVKAKSS
ncbi:MAG: hypothetical protein SGILL_001865 [Bacillariaceae sp.]